MKLFHKTPKGCVILKKIPKPFFVLIFIAVLVSVMVPKLDESKTSAAEETTPTSWYDSEISSTAFDGSSDSSENYRTTTTRTYDYSSNYESSTWDDISVPSTHRATVPNDDYYPYITHQYLYWYEQAHPSTNPPSLPDREAVKNDNMISGTCGDSATWSLNTETGILTVDGNGKIDSRFVPVWNAWKEQIKAVVIKDGITEIGFCAFSGCTNLESVDLGEVKIIGDKAFAACLSLASIEIPDTVESIGYQAFYGCLNLKAIRIGNGVEHIGVQAFYETNYYWNEDNWDNGVLYIDNYLIKAGSVENKSYTIKDGTRVIAPRAFSTTHITSVTIPDSVVEIGEHAFSGNGYTLTSVELPQNLKRIGDYAFLHCSDLTEISIPAKVESIGIAAFLNCSIAKFEVDENNPYFCTDESGVLYSKDKTSLIFYPTAKSTTEYTVPESVVSINDYAFALSKNLKKISLSESIASFGFGAFADCKSLEDINISDNITSLNNYELYGCSALKNFSTGDGITEICVDNFDYCTLETFEIGKNVKKLYSQYTSTTYIRTAKFIVDPDNPYFSSDENGLLYNKDKTILIRYPSENPAETFELPSDTIWMDGLSLTYCNNIKNIALHANYEGWTSYNYNGYHGSDYGFNNCYGLEKIIISEDNPKYSSDENGIMFSKDKTVLLRYPNGKSETTYDIPSHVKIISEDAFYGCLNITSMDFPEGITEIRDSAFYQCRKLTSISIPSSVTNVDSWAFRYCSELSKIEIDDGARGFYYDSFEGTAYYYDANNWENDILYIGNHLIDSEQEISGEVTVKKGTVSISGGAFSGKNLLTSITLPDTLEYIGDEAFSHCIVLRDILFPDSLKYIGEFAFYECDAIENISIPKSITRIECYSFANCDNIKSVSIPKSVTAINFTAFLNSFGISDVYYSGCENDWNSISIINSWDEDREVDEPLFENEEAVTIHFGEENPEKPTVPDLDYAPTTTTDTNTNIGIEYVPAYYNGEVGISVEQSFDEAAFSVITTQLDVTQNTVFDIKLTVDGVETQPNGTVKVKIPLPEGYDPSRSFVYHVNTETLKLERMPAEYIDGYMVFVTDHFSYYAIVEESHSINIAQDNINLCYKQKVKIDAETTGKVIYTSSDNSVATVDSEGNITAVGIGSATITATIDGTDISDSCEINVSYAWWQWIIRILLLGFLWY